MDVKVATDADSNEIAWGSRYESTRIRSEM